jgi:hypothetical protein
MSELTRYYVDRLCIQPESSLDVAVYSVADVAPILARLRTVEEAGLVWLECHKRELVLIEKPNWKLSPEFPVLCREIDDAEDALESALEGR